MAGKKEFSFNAEQVASFLQNAVSKVREDEDPFEMNELKKLFKKNVPFSMRMYVAAYLTKQLAGYGNRGGYNRYGRERTNRYNSDRIDSRRRYGDSSTMGHSSERAPIDSMGSKPPISRVVIDEKYAKTVFISIGRNRHVFTRDLIALISAAGGVDRERIGDIKIYDNYSFVTLFAEDAASVISLLNEYEYRGRKLSVSYSRKKEDLDRQSAPQAAQSDAPAYTESAPAPASEAPQAETAAAAPTNEE